MLFRSVETARQLAEKMGYDLFPDHNVFREVLDITLHELKIKLSVSEKKAIVDAISWRDPEAPPVIRRTLKDGTIEYEPDSELRDTEQVPFTEEGGIEAFFNRECLPYVPDAWIDESKTKIGYELSFTRYFYKPQPLRSLDAIKADIVSAESESVGLLGAILGTEK